MTDSLTGDYARTDTPVERSAPAKIIDRIGPLRPPLRRIDCTPDDGKPRRRQAIP